MKTEKYSAPAQVAFELEDELRRSGAQLRDTRERVQEAEARQTARLARCQRTHGILQAVHSVGSAAAGLTPIIGEGLGHPLPEEPVAVVQKSWQLLGRLSEVTASAVSEAEETKGLVRQRSRALGQEEASLDRELRDLRAALLRQLGT